MTTKHERNFYASEGREPSIREAAQALCDIIETCGYAPNPTVSRAVASMHAALDRPEPSRPNVLPDMALAQEGIAIVKGSRPGLNADHVRAVVELAEHGIEQLAQFDVRWDADMRAIRRWKEAHPQMVENLFWPDHADLVVWLLDLIELPSEFPAIADVDRMTVELRTRVDIASGPVTPLRRAAADIIVQLADALRYSERSRFAAGHKYAGAMDLLAEAGRLFRQYEAHHLDNVRPFDPTGHASRNVSSRIAAEKARRNAEIAERIEAALGLDVANDRAGA